VGLVELRLDNATLLRQDRACGYLSGPDIAAESHSGEAQQFLRLAVASVLRPGIRTPRCVVGQFRRSGTFSAARAFGGGNGVKESLSRSCLYIRRRPTEKVFRHNYDIGLQLKSLSI
jgi:hypothetical protein